MAFGFVHAPLFGDKHLSPLATIIFPPFHAGDSWRCGVLAQRREPERSDGSRSGARTPHRRHLAPTSAYPPLPDSPQGVGSVPPFDFLAFSMR
jgi:hypothetical protein